MKRMFKELMKTGSMIDGLRLRSCHQEKKPHEEEGISKYSTVGPEVKTDFYLFIYMLITKSTF